LLRLLTLQIVILRADERDAMEKQTRELRLLALSVRPLFSRSAPASWGSARDLFSFPAVCRAPSARRTAESSKVEVFPIQVAARRRRAVIPRLFAAHVFLGRQRPMLLSLMSV
jgi:hypothetical protein